MRSLYQGAVTLSALLSFMSNLMRRSPLSRNLLIRDILFDGAEAEKKRMGEKSESRLLRLLPLTVMLGISHLRDVAPYNWPK